jgi:uncharacterized protein (DUF305 family)
MKRFLTTLAVLSLTVPALAQDHSAHGSATNETENAATAAYRDANAAMHSAMAVELTGDADVDFILSMLPHHRGAVDMARIVLEHGTDPDVRAFAEQIIDTQEAEIAWMEAWLDAEGHSGH